MKQRWTDNDLILEQAGITLAFAVMCSWTVFRDASGTHDGPRWLLALVYAGFLGCWVWEHHGRVRPLPARVRREGWRSLSRTDISTTVSFLACVALAATALAS